MCQLKQSIAASAVKNSDVTEEAKRGCRFKLNFYKLLMQPSFVIYLLEN